jgi:hypothetical protein
MHATHCTIDDLIATLAVINQRYFDNIRFYENPQRDRKGVSFRLKVNNSKGIGSAFSHTKHTGSACWHVHGHFFEELFKIIPGAKVISAKSTVTKGSGNWEDYNIGSQADPLYASEACGCDFYEEVSGNATPSLEDVIQALKTMSADRIVDLLDSYRRMYGTFNRRMYGTFILTHCDEKVLPLFVNETDKKLMAIVGKRLRSRRAA